jgi:hypothetical protein
MARVLIERIETHLSRIEIICEDEIIDLFVSEYLQENGSRQYQNATFFSENFVVEATRFVTDDELDMGRLKDSIYHIQINTKAYDWRRATDESRINLTARFGPPNLTVELKGSKENCDHALSIFEVLKA